MYLIIHTYNIHTYIIHTYLSTSHILTTNSLTNDNLFAMMSSSAKAKSSAADKHDRQSNTKPSEKKSEDIIKCSFCEYTTSSDNSIGFFTHHRLNHPGKDLPGWARIPAILNEGSKCKSCPNNGRGITPDEECSLAPLPVAEYESTTYSQVRKGITQVRRGTTICIDKRNDVSHYARLGLGKLGIHFQCKECIRDMLIRLVDEGKQTLRIKNPHFSGKFNEDENLPFVNELLVQLRREGSEITASKLMNKLQEITSSRSIDVDVSWLTRTKTSSEMPRILITTKTSTLFHNLRECLRQLVHIEEAAFQMAKMEEGKTSELCTFCASAGRTGKDRNTRMLHKLGNKLKLPCYACLQELLSAGGNHVIQDGVMIVTNKFHDPTSPDPLLHTPVFNFKLNLVHASPNMPPYLMLLPLALDKSEYLEKATTIMETQKVLNQRSMISSRFIRKKSLALLGKFADSKNVPVLRREDYVEALKLLAQIIVKVKPEDLVMINKVMLKPSGRSGNGDVIEWEHADNEAVDKIVSSNRAVLLYNGVALQSGKQVLIKHCTKLEDIDRLRAQCSNQGIATAAAIFTPISHTTPQCAYNGEELCQRLLNKLNMPNHTEDNIWHSGSNSLNNPNSAFSFVVWVDALRAVKDIEGFSFRPTVSAFFQQRMRSFYPFTREVAPWMPSGRADHLGLDNGGLQLDDATRSVMPTMPQPTEIEAAIASAEIQTMIDNAVSATSSINVPRISNKQLNVLKNFDPDILLGAVVAVTGRQANGLSQAVIKSLAILLGAESTVTKVTKGTSVLIMQTSTKSNKESEARERNITVIESQDLVDYADSTDLLSLVETEMDDIDTDKLLEDKIVETVATRAEQAMAKSLQSTDDKQDTTKDDNEEDCVSVKCSGNSSTVQATMKVQDKASCARSEKIAQTKEQLKQVSAEAEERRKKVSEFQSTVLTRNQEADARMKENVPEISFNNNHKTSTTSRKRHHNETLGDVGSSSVLPILEEPSLPISLFNTQCTSNNGDSNFSIKHDSNNIQLEIILQDGDSHFNAQLPAKLKIQASVNSNELNKVIRNSSTQVVNVAKLRVKKNSREEFTQLYKKCGNGDIPRIQIGRRSWMYLVVPKLHKQIEHLENMSINSDRTYALLVKQTVLI